MLKGEKSMKDKLIHLLIRTGIFLLRGAGWASVGVLVGFVSSYFYRLPGRVDTFALTETLLGVVITGLSIVGAFMIVLQWGTLESKMHGFDIKVRETNEFFTNLASENAKEVADMSIRRKMFEMSEDKMMKNHQELLQQSYKNQREVGKMIDDYKKVIEDLDAQRKDRDGEAEQMIREYKKVIDDTTHLQDQLYKIVEDLQRDIKKNAEKFPQ